MRRGFCGALIAAIGLCQAAVDNASGADVLFVDTQSPDCSDTTGAPYCRIQAAIDGASTGATIRIGSGIYELWGESITIDRSLELEGAGPDETVIDGEGRHPGPIISIGASAENVRIRALTLTNRARMVTVTAGAGGIDHAGLHLTLSHVVIRENQGGMGGALHAGTRFGSVRLENVTLSDNTALVGGGIDFRDAPDAHLEITSSDIRNNSAVFTGGGIFIRDVGPVTMVGVSISGNESGNQGGGIYLVSQVEAVELLVRDSVISENWSKGSGGIATSGDDTEVRLAGVMLAGNRSEKDPRTSDCLAEAGDVFESMGGNLVGNGDGCAFRATHSDMVGTTATPAARGNR